MRSEVWTHSGTGSVTPCDTVLRDSLKDRGAPDGESETRVR